MERPQIEEASMTPRICDLCHKPVHALNPLRTRHRECVKFSLGRCACGSLIRARGAESCKRCQQLKRKAVAGKPLPHIPTSIYVQHDAVASRERWRQAVQR